MYYDIFPRFDLKAELAFYPPADIQDEDEDDADGHDGHRGRLRQQLSKNRLDELKPPAVVEFLLGGVLPRQDIAPVAMAMLEQFGDLPTLLQADLDQFLQVKGLGEAGAQWMDMVCRCMRGFRDAQDYPDPVISNYRQLRRHAFWLNRYFRTPCCIQLLCDDAGHIIMRRPLVHGLNWGGVETLCIAANDASSLHAASAYIIIITDDVRKHPNRYDLKCMRNYLRLMKHTPCTPRDIFFLDGRRCFSLHRMGLNSQEDPHSRRVAERQIANPPGDELILYRHIGPGPAIKTRIPICDLEVENERTEPV